MIYALDSNIVSYILKEDERVIERFEKEIIHEGYPYVIPPAAVYELKRWFMEYKSKAYLAFAQSFDILYQSVRNYAFMSAPAWEKAAEVYLQLKQFTALSACSLGAQSHAFYYLMQISTLFASSLFNTR